MEENLKLITGNLLYKLYRKGIWGAKHTPIRNLYHLVDKASIRESEKAIKNLANLNWVLLKKSTGKIHISLNAHKKQEIKSFILEILKINPEFLK